MATRVLIRGATLLDGRATDVRLADGRVAAMGALPPARDEAVIEARGGLLLPGLHDHHIHLCAHAAALASVRCGPPEVTTAAGLARALDRPGKGWLRGVGYHEGVAGLLDTRALDGMVPDRPVRLQHRGGRMWFLNSAALARLAHLPPPPGLELTAGRPTGRLIDSDDWLRAAIGTGPPALDEVGARLAARGVTGPVPRPPPTTLRWPPTSRASGRAARCRSGCCSPAAPSWIARRCRRAWYWARSRSTCTTRRCPRWTSWSRSRAPRAPRAGRWRSTA